VKIPGYPALTGAGDGHAAQSTEDNSMAIDAELLRKIAPQVGGAKGQKQAQIIDALGPVLTQTLDKFEINSDLRAAHFLAQTCHESDGFCTTVEYASGDLYEGRPDLGNTEPGDGRRYKGRGLIQLTGRANYRRYGDLLNLDLVGNPDLAADPATSLTIACEYWREHGLNAFADRDDIEIITQRINGALGGLESRRSYLVRAKAALGIAGASAAATAPRTTLRLGSSGAQVAELQSVLAKKKFAVTADGQFGPATAAAVEQFQTGQGLPADGVVGPQTWDALTRA
jgi:putative chitinase